MTRDEAIKQCEDFIQNRGNWSVEEEWANGVQFVLEDYKRLIEQQPISNILDDIYTEIEDKYEDCVIGKLDDDDEMYPCFRRTGSIDGVFDILDKYKAESKDKA